MLMPSAKPIFENISSREYHARAEELKKARVDGCIHIAFPDFEEVIVFSEGRAVTALHESKRWLTVGDDLVEAAENKAISAAGRMSAYSLSPALLHLFLHQSVKTMVETELGPYLTAKLLIGYLAGDKSTCILKFQDQRSTGYVFMNFGNRVGAVYDSPEGRSYDDAAVNSMGRFKEHTSVAIYFMELSEKYLRSKAEARVEAPAPRIVAPVAPVEPMAPVAPAVPREPIASFPVTPSAAADQKIKPVRAKPVKVPRPAGVKLVVAVSDDSFLGISHLSRQRTLETLEENSVAWVDRKTLDSVNAPDRKAYMTLPDGREFAILLKEATFGSAESRYIILPRKLRNRLAVAKGAVVEIKV